MLSEYYKNNPIISKAMNWSIECHKSTNHMYDTHDYSYHLEMVFNYGVRFSHLLDNESDVINALCGCWSHDTIEDTRVTYNDVKNVLGEAVADIAFDLTNEKGKTRKDRANDKYYSAIKSNKISLFVKICDRLANVSYSLQKNSKMISVYLNEYEEFKSKLFDKKYQSMFDEIEKMLG